MEEDERLEGGGGGGRFAKVARLAALLLALAAAQAPTAAAAADAKIVGYDMDLKGISIGGPKEGPITKLNDVHVLRRFMYR